MSGVLKTIHNLAYTKKPILSVVTKICKKIKKIKFFNPHYMKSGTYIKFKLLHITFSREDLQ